MKFKLVTFTTPFCTTGKLYDEQGNQILVTIEKPYLDNLKNKSCVHPGLYSFNPRVSPSKGHTYYLENHQLAVTLHPVIGEPTWRDYIQIDIANKQSQLLGCIAVGLSFGVMDGEWCVRDSGKAKRKLMNILNGERHQLEIFRH